MTRYERVFFHLTPRKSALWALLWPIFLGGPRVAALEDSAEDLIQQAGNVEDDAARLQLLLRLRDIEGLDPALKGDVDKMVAFVSRWRDEPSLFGWFSKPIRTHLRYDIGVSEDSPLYPLDCFYQGRMLVWVTNEYGNIIGYHEERRKFLDEAVKRFRIAKDAFPDNRVIGMYLGEPIPWEKDLAVPETAPQWAQHQREALERLTDIVEWWIRNRLREDGEYGGGWDDDCEMWRHWVPVMIAFEHEEAAEAQAFFSKALLSQSYMKGGYTSRMYDVEHTAEPSTDTITPMMHLAPEDTLWKEKALRIAELMRELWTGGNDRGFLQFKSTYFSWDKVDPSPVRACDTPYHVVALPPPLLLWLRTGDASLEELFTAWMDTWVDATAREEAGKPSGVIPAAIRWPGGETRGPGEAWWDPRHHGEPRLYEWPSAVSKMTDCLLLAWFMTGKEKYLEPIRSMAAIRREVLDDPPAVPPKPGGKDWCGSKLGFLAGTLAKHKLLTGSEEFDDILDRDYKAFDLREDNGERPALASALRRSVEALRVNFPAYTSEVRFTDRVLTFPRLFGKDMIFADEVPSSCKRADPRLLYAAATGDRGAFMPFPINAVRWLTQPRDIAALVTKSSRNSFEAELFHFGQEERSLAAELYLLSPGTYQVTLAEKETGAGLMPRRPLEVSKSRTRVSFSLPPGRLCVLRVR